MTINKLRHIYIKYFISKNYKFFCHSHLTIFNDNSLFFVNSGMVQFKKNYLNLIKINFNKVLTIQPCLRISGKHNDLYDIGLKKNHHTFFEMLGNFAFNDFSKLEILFLNWELLTKFYKIPKNKLYVTVYYKDYDTYNIWLNIIKIHINNLIKIYDLNNIKYNSENFWSIDDHGLCGECTEVFYKTKNNISFIKNKNYFIEIFNIVFIKYNKSSNGSLLKLNTTYIDVGWGLERLLAIYEKKNSSYKTKIFLYFILKISRYIKIFNIHHNFLKIISDHFRTCIFLINDNIIPQNSGRGYILRHILRRIFLKLYLLGLKKFYLYNLVDYFIYKMKYYKYLSLKNSYIKNILVIEENNYFNFFKKKFFFFKKKLLINNIIKNNILYYFHSTLGFSLDLSIFFFKNLCFILNKGEFKKFFIFNKKLSKKNFFKKNFFIKNFLNKKKTKILSIYYNKNFLKKITKNNWGYLILNNNYFFPENKDQPGDQGYIFNKNFLFSIKNTIYLNYNIISLFGVVLKGTLKLNDLIFLNLNILKKFYISCNHSALHIFYKIIKDILGKKNIKKISSYLNFKKTNIDLRLKNNLYDYELSLSELIFNKEIIFNLKSKNFFLNLKYKNIKNFLILNRFKIYNKIRFVRVGSSFNFCLGTHIFKTNFLNFFKIINIKNINLNIKRIEFSTNIFFFFFIQKNLFFLKKIFNLLKIKSCKYLLEIINNLIKKNKINYNFNNFYKNKYFFYLKNFLFKNFLIIFKKIFFIKKNIFFNNFNFLNFFNLSFLLKKKNFFIFIYFINNNIINIVFFINYYLFKKIYINFIISLFLKNFNGFSYKIFNYINFKIKKNNFYFFFINFLENLIIKNIYLKSDLNRQI